MLISHMPMLLVLASATVPLLAQQSTETASARAVRVEGTVNAPVEQVWRVFTTSEGAEEFFAQKANIGLAIGGPYEIQFDPKDERSGTKGLIWSDPVNLCSCCGWLIFSSTGPATAESDESDD